MVTSQPKTRCYLTRIDALVNHTNEANFDDGGFRIHDFGRQSLSMAKWTEFTALNLKHAKLCKPARLIIVSALMCRQSLRSMTSRPPDGFISQANVFSEYTHKPFGADAHLRCWGRSSHHL